MDIHGILHYGDRDDRRFQTQQLIYGLLPTTLTVALVSIPAAFPEGHAQAVSVTLSASSHQPVSFPEPT